MEQSENQRQRRLKKMKCWALGLLLLMACIYAAATCLYKNNPASPFFAAFSEAAMVGAIADWFAVVALFRHPLGIPVWHTAIIPKSKDSIADNLSRFVREKFLKVDDIAKLIKQHDPAKKLSDWLVEPDNTKRLGGHLLRLAANILDFIEDEPVQKLIAQLVRASLAKIDLSKSAGVILESLIKNGHHQALLDEAIHQFASKLRNEETQALIAGGIVRWLKEEHPIKEKVLPSEWIGGRGAEMMVIAVSRLLNEIDIDKNHTIRTEFDDYTRDLINKLQSDPEFIARGEEFKGNLQVILDEKLKSVWSPLRDWLKKDIESSDSRIHKNIIETAQWLGKKLADDEELRKSFNAHIGESAKNMAPDFEVFLTNHIRDTVKGWDSQEMSKQIELNIGSDLQFIRINGALVGGLVGLGIYSLSYFAGVSGLIR